ncbi:MAG: histidine kinase dimerization/phospho-acceptor domain-containing protein [Bacteroidales bacterium]|nr:histidine kinase dimerization/phospho-acceptor domain-containing protein [Bacteroidales bacterium]
MLLLDINKDSAFMNSSNVLHIANENVVTTTMSHELKTPLNAIIGFTDLILEEDSINKIKDYADIIRNNSELLLDKIHKVIDYNSLDHDNAIFIERVLISEMVERARKIISAEFAKKNIDFHISTNPAIIEHSLALFIDISKLEKLLCHLLLSAVYLNKCGDIFIDFNLVKNDNGDEFQMMISVDQNQLSKKLEDGIGINLAICEKLSKKVGGQMRLRLNETNKTIAFELPIRNLYQEADLPSHKLVVLVVDDDSERFAIVNKMLQKFSFQIIRTSENGFIEGATNYLDHIGIIVLNNSKSIPGINREIKNIREKNKDISFLINMKNHHSLEAFSGSYENVLWFRPTTLKDQLGKIIDTHFRNKNMANPFLKSGYDRNK